MKSYVVYREREVGETNVPKVTDQNHLSWLLPFAGQEPQVSG